MANSNSEQAFVDLEIRVLQEREAGYPVEITLDMQQEFPRGYLPADILPWQATGDFIEDGKKLFAALFSDANLREAWAEARGQAQQRRIRLRIDSTAPELHTLPWELLQENQVMLSANGATPFSRYLPVALPWGGLVEECPIRVLVVISNPANLQSDYDLAQLDVDAERAVLESAAEEIGEEALQVEFMEPPITLERLEEALRDGYHVLHYLGHGAFSRRRGQAALYLQDESGDVQIVTDDTLIGMLARQTTHPKLVFLAACQSAVRDTGDAFLGLGPKLISVGVPAVVAMQDFVSMETARKLNEKFYQRLAEQGSIDRAMNEARSTLLTAGRPDAAVPVLFLRLKSGQLWDIEADARGEILGARNPRIFWSGLIKMIQRGKCIPIVGPRVHNRWLPNPGNVAARWSSIHGYPFPDKEELARVAQYMASNQGEDFPRYELLDTLKAEFRRRLPEELRPEEEMETLVELVDVVGWENLTAGDPNEAHTVLARLDLPLYLTTNLDGFMTKALMANGKDPARELCRWNVNLDWLPSLFEDDPDYEPTEEAPLVYHLFGTDEEVESLVITEDNYLDFLVQVSAEMDRIPNYIRGALSNASLMFVGYSLYDWEFRVIMRGLVANMDQRRRFKHVAVQLEVDDVGQSDVNAVQSFLQQYFQDADINVFWGSTAQFIAELREQWEAR